MKVKILKTLFLVLVAFGFLFVNVSIEADAFNDDMIDLEEEAPIPGPDKSRAATNDKAYCWATGKVCRIYSPSYLSTPYAYIYIATPLTSMTSGKWYSFYTYRTSAIAALAAAQAGNLTVQLRGNRSCPSSGSGNCGLLEYYYIFQNK